MVGRGHMPQLPCGDQDIFAVSRFSPSTFTRGLRFSLVIIVHPFGLVGKAYTSAHRERGQEPEAGNVSLTCDKGPGHIRECGNSRMERGDR